VTTTGCFCAYLFLTFQAIQRVPAAADYLANRSPANSTAAAGIRKTTDDASVGSAVLSWPTPHIVRLLPCTMRKARHSATYPQGDWMRRALRLGRRTGLYLSDAPSLFALSAVFAEGFKAAGHSVRSNRTRRPMYGAHSGFSSVFVFSVYRHLLAAGLFDFPYGGSTDVKSDFWPPLSYPTLAGIVASRPTLACGPDSGRVRIRPVSPTPSIICSQRYRQVGRQKPCEVNSASSLSVPSSATFTLLKRDAETEGLDLGIFNVGGTRKPTRRTCRSIFSCILLSLPPSPPPFPFLPLTWSARKGKRIWQTMSV